MDNNFEKQFMENVASTPATNEPAVMPDTKSTKNGLDIFKVLAIVTVVLNIVIIIMIGILMNNMASSTNNVDRPVEALKDEDLEVGDSSNLYYVFDDDRNLIAMTNTCTKDDGATLKFSNDNTYTESDGQSYTTNSGTYSILRDDIITIVDTKNNSRVLYYDGFIVADGETIYECE